MGLSPRMSKGRKGESSCSLFFLFTSSSPAHFCVCVFFIFCFLPSLPSFSEAVISFCHALFFFFPPPPSSLKEEML